MTDAALIILVHQLLFQGMFLAKNALLRRKLGQPIRGDNPEASVSIAFFAAFIALSFWLAVSGHPWGYLPVLGGDAAMLLSLPLLALNLLIGLASLRDLGDSWRVGVLDQQRTTLVHSGIYRYSRNPYFLSYLLMFTGYTLLLQNTILLALSLLGFALIHMMIRREERYLLDVHGDDFRRYCQRTPRYLLR
jgi:protein-S-isoprenylcysteine O-methyltransferase Ste14